MEANATREPNRKGWRESIREPCYRIGHMAKRSHLHALAALGAKMRVQELKAELAHLYQSFPSLRTVARAAVAAVTPDAAPRKKRTMSRKARAAISRAQKARWAKQKAAVPSPAKKKS